MKSDLEKKLDAALCRVARVQPPPGLEDRVRVRLELESMRIKKGPSFRLGQFFRVPRPVFAALAAVAGCALIVAGSVQHSRQRALEGAVPPAGIHLAAPDTGMGAASGARISPQSIVAPGNNRARSERKVGSGRALIRKDAHKPAGVLVPESPGHRP
jgi:hypothetical protein